MIKNYESNQIISAPELIFKLLIKKELQLWPQTLELTKKPFRKCNNSEENFGKFLPITVIQTAGQQISCLVVNSGVIDSRKALRMDAFYDKI